MPFRALCYEKRKIRSVLITITDKIINTTCDMVYVYLYTRTLSKVSHWIWNQSKNLKKSIVYIIKLTSHFIRKYSINKKKDAIIF